MEGKDEEVEREKEKGDVFSPENLFRYFRFGVFVILMLLLLVAVFQFYFSALSAISSIFKYEFGPLVQAIFALCVAVVVLCSLRWVIASGRK